MSEVVIVGIGQLPVGEHWDISLRQMAVRAARQAMEQSAGLVPQAIYIGNMLASTLSHQANLGSLIADELAMRGTEGVTIEAAGASGGAALRQAYLAILSGFVDVALVIGVEKYTDQVGPSVEAAVSQMLESDYEAMQGMTPTSQAGLIMQRYLHEYQVDREVFAAFPLLAHTNGVDNPNAMYRKVIKPEAYQRAEMISDPLNLFDMAPYADGAAALLLARAALVPESFTHPLVRITGSSVVIDTLALHDRPDPLAFHAAEYSVARACRQAGILPADVDLFELADAFSVYAAISLEAAGFASRGQGWKLAKNGDLARTGQMPIATLGGLKARGNPIGATGVYQVIEAVLQLRGEAGSGQVAGARRAMVQSLGGPASTAVTHVLERWDGER